MAHTENYITQAAGDARYQQLGSLGSSNPSTIDPDDAASAGVSSSASRQDHQHPITTGTPANIGLTGVNSESSGTGFARDLHVHAYNPPACRVYNNANISIVTSGVSQTLTFNSERFDTDTMHDTVTDNGRITIKTAGIYVVTANVQFATNATGARAVDILLNGATAIGSVLLAAVTGFPTRIEVSTIHKLAVNDYLQVNVFQTSGGALNAERSADYAPEFAATWIGVG